MSTDGLGAFTLRVVAFVWFSMGDQDRALRVDLPDSFSDWAIHWSTADIVHRRDLAPTRNPPGKAPDEIIL